MSRRWLGMSIGLGFLAAGLSLPIMAHHSLSAEFDTTKPINFTGTVKKVDWGNPHIYTHVETKEGDKAVVYKVEGAAPNDLYRRGWRADSVKIGETVSVRGIRAKNATSPNIGNASITRGNQPIFSGNGPAGR